MCVVPAAPREQKPSLKTKTYKFIGFGDIHGPEPYKFIGFGDIHGPLRPAGQDKVCKFVIRESAEWAEPLEKVSLVPIGAP